jgi:hypothetical protein
MAERTTISGGVLTASLPITTIKVPYDHNEDNEEVATDAPIFFVNARGRPDVVQLLANRVSDVDFSWQWAVAEYRGNLVLLLFLSIGEVEPFVLRFRLDTPEKAQVLFLLAFFNLPLRLASSQNIHQERYLELACPIDDGIRMVIICVPGEAEEHLTFENEGKEYDIEAIRCLIREKMQVKTA